MARFGILLVAVVFAAACGASAVSEGPTVAEPGTPGAPAGGVAGMCMPDVPDCVDTVIEPAEGDDDEIRERARALLGVAEADLPDEVRVGRRGEEQMALTEDYQVGRLTAELDADDAGVFRVTAVVAELAQAPETITAE